MLEVSELKGAGVPEAQVPEISGDVDPDSTD